jgi:protein-L-isoaspartate O-methyltransferase
MNLRQKLYDHLFGDVNLPTSTTNLYYSFLQRMKQGTKILDIGVGTGIYFEDSHCTKLIKEKNIKIVGIDINKPDIELASQRIIESDLGMNVEAKYVDLFEYDGDLNEFDVILFSESYPVIPRDLMKKMLMFIVHSKGFSGELVFINNVEDDPTWVQKNTKDLLKYVMFGIEFGRLVSTDDMMGMFTSVGIENEVTFELLASSTPNYALFSDKIKIPGLNCEMKQYMISVKI